MVDRIGEAVRNYWPVLAGLFAIAAAWGASTLQINMLVNGQTRFDAAQVRMEGKLDRLLENVASAQTQVQFATRDIDKLSSRVDALETTKR